MSLRISPGGLNFRVRDTKHESVQWTVSPKRQLYKKYLAAEVVGHRFGQAAVLERNTPRRRRTGGTNPKESCTLRFTLVFYDVKKQKDHLLQDDLFAVTWQRLTFPGGRANQSFFVDVALAA